MRTPVSPSNTPHVRFVSSFCFSCLLESSTGRTGERGPEEEGGERGEPSKRGVRETCPPGRELERRCCVILPPPAPAGLLPWQLLETGAERERSRSPVVNGEAKRTLNQSKVTEQYRQEELGEFSTTASRWEKGAKGSLSERCWS